MLRDRSNGTRGQRRRQERHPHFVTSQSFRTAPRRLNARAPGVCEPSSILHQGRTRSDLLFTMSNNTRTSRQAWAARNLFICGRAKRAVASAAFIFFARTHSLSGHRGDKSFAPEPEQKRMPTRSFENRRHHARQTTKPARAAECRIVTRRIVTAGLVEPDGIEPTTSCLQSRRSPN